MIDLNLFFQLLKGCCHGNQFWQNDLYLHLHVHICKIGRVKPDITRVTTAPLWMRQQKLAYFTDYLRKYQSDLYQTFSINRHVYEDYKINISFAVAQGLLLW